LPLIVAAISINLEDHAAQPPLGRCMDPSALAAVEAEPPYSKTLGMLMIAFHSHAPEK
jgi:hypothetical protein